MEYDSRMVMKFGPNPTFKDDPTWKRWGPDDFDKEELFYIQKPWDNINNNWE